MGTRLSFVLGLLVAACMTASAQKYYDPDVLGIIGNHGCTNCHGSSGGLTVTPYSNIMSTGNHAPVVVANDSNSTLVLKLKGTASFGSRMPLGGPYLTNSEINVIVQWIMGGAKEKATSAVATAGSMPTEFELFQNHPNPFNPSTVVSYQLPQASNVTLAVYDLIGREVFTLVDGMKEAGVHEVQFDASGLSSGVYLYRLTAGSFIQTRKLVLSK